MKRILSIFLCLLFVVIAVDEVDAQKRRRGGKGKKPRVDHGPKVGDVAPGFTLASEDGESETSLAEFKGNRPVVLLFGSYT